MKKIIILTGSEMRHDFFRKALALQEGIKVIKSYCEGTEQSLASQLKSREKVSEVEKMHVDGRTNSELDFFETFVKVAPDISNAVTLPKGEINQPNHIDSIINQNPDLLIAYGCSIIKGDLLKKFEGRFLNIHLGISPRYRGSGTNFWALVNNEPEFFGATFMHMHERLDAGGIIHQIRARVLPGDSPHQIGNRLISDMVFAYADIIRNFEKLAIPPLPKEEDFIYLYKRKDFSHAAVQKLYEQFKNNMIEEYIENMETRQKKAPLIQNLALKDI